MNSNPVLKPRLATPALILVSATVSIAAGFFLATLAAGVPSGGILMIVGLGILLAVGVLGVLWLTRFRRRRAWMMAAERRWHHFEEVRRNHRTTTEITVLSVDALEPTGSWITINWNRFEHVQQAWIEALPDPIWPGSVLLISPDRAQVRPGGPWPRTYFLCAQDCLAWAPPKSTVNNPGTSFQQ